MGFKPLGSDGSEVDAPIVAEINITPLTDIFLVLLIIFMVTSSAMSQSGVGVDLPKASQESSQSQPDGVIVTLMSGSKLLVNQKEVVAGNWERLESLIQEAFTQTKSRLVILEGDRQAFLGSAIEVMDHARKAGADRFAIATSPEKKN